MNSKQFVISTVSSVVKIVVAVVLIMLIYKWAGQAYEFGYRVFTEEPVSAAPGMDYSVTITEETSARQVAKALEDYGLIKDKTLFYIQYEMSQYKKTGFVPGTYTLNTSQTAEEMMAVLSASEEEDTAAGASGSGTAASETGDAETAVDETGEETATEETTEEE